jgi:Ca2+/Na+ antiporter
VVLPFPGLIAPEPVEFALVARDYTAVLILTLLMTFFCYRAVKNGKMIGRKYGAAFLSIYCVWFTVMFLQV